MSDMAQQQRVIMAALAQGPDALPDGMIAGGRDRALMAMKVHANTIWHARLVALEDTFPRTRNAMGEAAFNQMSRAFIETPSAGAVPLAQIGRDFPAFVSAHDYIAAGQLAAFEWAWLISFHTADARPITLANLAGLNEDALLALRVGRHPAAISLSPVPDALIADHGLLKGAGAVLLTRPDADVMIGACSPLMAAMLEQMASGATIGNLLTGAGEQGAEDDALPTLIALIEAGALILITGD